MDSANTVPVLLKGNAYDRGLAQKNDQVRSSVADAVNSRLQSIRLTGPAEQFLEDQWQIATSSFSAQIEELKGIATAFDIHIDRLFIYLNATLLEEQFPTAITLDGCSTWGLPNTGAGPILCKNRDYRGEHKNLQAVFLHRDENLAGGQYLTVGSYGSPGGFSSGMNGVGFALVDTQIATREHGPGAIRYLLMNKLLSEASSTDEALQIIRSTCHVGGGSLSMADENGVMAVVELGYSYTHIQRTETDAISRTNHFVHPDLASNYFYNKDDLIRNTSKGRLERLHAELPDFDTSRPLEAAKTLGSSHDNQLAGLCSHSESSSTLSCAIYLCKQRMLYFSDQNPCLNDWHAYQIE